MSLSPTTSRHLLHGANAGEDVGLFAVEDVPNLLRGHEVLVDLGLHGCQSATHHLHHCKRPIHPVSFSVLILTLGSWRQAPKAVVTKIGQNIVLHAGGRKKMKNVVKEGREYTTGMPPKGRTLYELHLARGFLRVHTAVPWLKIEGGTISVCVLV